MHLARPTVPLARPAWARLSLVVALVAGALPLHAQNGPLRQAIERAREARQARGGEGLDDGADERGSVTLPRNVRVERDVSYGSDPKQRFDVYVPAGVSRAPVILLVHGGGWRTGDKGARSVVENKVAHWARAGIVVISVNYRLLPAANPLDQAHDVALAVAAAQQRLARWGGDPDRIVLVGHSAGAHLVALLATDASLIASEGARPVIGTVILDSAVLDVEQTMRLPHLPLYDAAFGKDKRFWRAVSPYRQLGAGASPFLVVCSSKRQESCPAATKFVKRAKAMGVRADVVQEAMSHREINDQLGVAGAYTAAVDAFLRTLDYSFARALRVS